MQNQENTEAKKLTKQEYNRRYYEKNKNRWNSKKSDSPLSNVFDLFGKAIRNPVTTDAVSTQLIRIFRILQIVLLVIFVIVATLFLIHEAAKFYIDEQEGTFIAYVKATMIEGLAVLLTFSRCKNRILMWIRKLVVILLCTFTLWVMSGKLIKTASSDTYRVQTLKRTLENLESELNQKEKLRQALLSKERLTAVRHYDKGIDQIRLKRDKVQERIVLERSPQVVANNLMILILFRLLLVLGNLVSIHTIVEYFRYDFSRHHPEPVEQTPEFS